MLKKHPQRPLICHFATGTEVKPSQEFEKNVLHQLSSALNETFQVPLFCFHTTV